MSYLVPYENDHGVIVVKLVKDEPDKAGMAAYFADEITAIEDSTVTSLIASMFEGKTRLQSVSFPNLQSAGNRAFFGCSDLTSVNAPRLTSIGESTFENCLKLESFTHGDVVTVNNRAFYGDAKIHSVDLPSAASIGQSAFQGCSSIASLDLPSAASIGQAAFQDCTSLPSLDLPNVTSVGNSAFNGCRVLASVYLPNAASIGKSAFAYCTSLTTVIAPRLTKVDGYILQMSSVETLDLSSKVTFVAYSFYEASNFNRLILRNSEVSPLSSTGAFAMCPFAQNGSGGTLFVPQALLNDYTNATNWSVLLSYPNNRILPIEGSEYDTTNTNT